MVKIAKENRFTNWLPGYPWALSMPCASGPRSLVVCCWSWSTFGAGFAIESAGHPRGRRRPRVPGQARRAGQGRRHDRRALCKYGTGLVSACVESGTHDCDLTGETPWIRSSIDAFDARTRAKKVRIVHCCGNDAIPFDIPSFSCGSWPTRTSVKKYSFSGK